MTVEEEIEKSIKLIEGDYKGVKEFKGVAPVYPFNTEDACSLFRSYKDYIKGKPVLTVTGSGDFLLDLIANGARDITCFDTNVLSKRVAELKLAFWKSHLGKELFLKFLAGDHCGDEILSYDIFKGCRNFFSPETLYYFESIYKIMKRQGLKITNAKSSILFQQFDSLFHFPVQNSTVGNQDSYLGYYVDALDEALVDTEDLHVRFLDKDVMDLGECLDEYYFIYLSNIFEFTSTFIDKKRLRMRLETFKKYVVDEIKPHLTDGGVLVAGYLQGSRNISDDVYHDKSKYPQIFSEQEGFLIDDVYGCKGKTIITANEEVLKRRKLDMYDFF